MKKTGPKYPPGCCPECGDKRAVFNSPNCVVCKTVGCVNCNVKPTMKYSPTPDFDLSWNVDELKTKPGSIPWLPLPPLPICKHTQSQYATHGSGTGYWCVDCGAYLHP